MTPALWHAGELELVSCDNCKNTETRKLSLRPDGMQVVECVSCGLAFLNPRPKPEFVPRLYENDYFTKTTVDSLIGYAEYLTKENRQALLSGAELRLQLLAPLWKPHGTYCLEIGCATGEFSYTLSQLGARLVGVDLSEFAIAQAKQSYPGIDFRPGGIDGLVGREVFDAVFAFELIEHVISPSSFFSDVNSMLKPEGILVLTTPNFDCGKRVGFDNWIGFTTSFEHLHFFSKQSLQQLSAQHNFILEAWFTGCGDGIGPRYDEKSLKRKIKLALHRLGLLKTVHQIKKRFWLNPSKPAYVQGGCQHNLFMVLRKQVVPPQSL
jgi:2-polyprenyl-3-methyl-5-hydroxy-6-metoxy-1,4-benzoquinol methylase